MGNHGMTSGRSHDGMTSHHTMKARRFQFQGPPVLALRDWSVSRRLIAVIVLALGMGLVFGGLRVAVAAGSAAQFGRVSQLANLGQQVTGLVQALEDERDETTGLLPITKPRDLRQWYDATDAAAARVRSLAAGVDGSFPANIQSRVASVVSMITNLSALRGTAQASQSALAVIADYSAPISEMIALNGEIAQGTSDASLASDVQALNSLSQAKDQAAQQRALLFNALSQQIFADGVQPALTTAQSQQLTDLTAFGTTATAEEQRTYRNTVAGPRVNQAQNIEIYIVGTGSLAIGAGALGISPAAAPGQWYSAQSATVDDMQQVERGIAAKIVARAQTLQRGAEQSALFNGVVTVLVLLLVLIAALAVARSMVRPLRRLREDALDIATTQLPQRVRQLSEAADPSGSLDVKPIEVMSANEIGQVARAFDQVHAEAVRLAANEAMLRLSFNAMFVNLSRRSQSLIERLVRLIDLLEQNEQDPGRLGNLFSMDHLVTRMRRNSENLLLLAGHDTARKWSGPVPLADVARAAASEIEQYRRVTLKIPPGIAVSGQAVSDLVHLLAELIENATVFSPEDTAVHVSAQELTSGGVLVDVSDSGVGVPTARLTEMNKRLDDPPVIDVSVSRHMGLFAVARLAERHGIRIRLRPRSPRGLTALVWLPDSVAVRGARPSFWRGGRLDRPASAHQAPDGHLAAPRPVPVGALADGRLDAVTAAQHTAQHDTAQHDTAPADVGSQHAPQAEAPPQAPRPGGAPTSIWFRSHAAAAGDGRLAEDPAPAAGGQPGSGGSSGPGGPAGPDLLGEARRATQVMAEPVRGDRTAAGLPVRVPRANLLPGSAAGQADDGTASPQAGRGGPRVPAPADRSPGLARSRLSGFQSGIQQAKDQTPATGEGNGQ